MKKKIALIVIFLLFCFYSDFNRISVEQSEEKEFLKRLNFQGKPYVPVDFSKMPKSMQRRLN
jgi:hypothetical protein